MFAEALSRLPPQPAETQVSEYRQRQSLLTDQLRAVSYTHLTLPTNC